MAQPNRILSEIRVAILLCPDLVLVQFGHNDSHDPENPEPTNPEGDFREFLRRYIDDSRAIDATRRS